jgi:3-hydroxyisobutyrate dehydrogenase
MQARIVGVVGLGMMGGPMADCLAAGGERILLYDVDHSKCIAAVRRTGGAAAASLRELGVAADVVITILPSSQIVEHALFGPGDCLADGLRKGTIVLEMSSGVPARTIEFGERLSRIGVHIADAPVSGGVPRAISGELTIMAGGEADILDACDPILRQLGSTVVRTGSLGSGQAMKALNNLVSAGGFLIAAEAILIGRKFGLEPETIVDVLNASTGVNNSTRNKMKQHVLSGTFASGFALDLMVKDLDIAMSIANEMDMNVPFSKLCHDHWAAGAKELGRNADHTAIARFSEEIADKPKGGG